MTPPTTAATRMLGVHIDPVRFEVIRNAILASTPAIHALAEATTTVPIVILSAGDPVDARLVINLKTAKALKGTTDPALLAELARGRLRGKLPALRQAFAGRFRGHHAFLIGQLLAHLDYLDEAIGILSGQVETVIAPFADAV